MHTGGLAGIRIGLCSAPFATVESILADKYLRPPRAQCDGNGVVCQATRMSAKLDAFASNSCRQDSSVLTALG